MISWRLDNPWLPRTAIFFAAYAALGYLLYLGLGLSGAIGHGSDNLLRMLMTSSLAANLSGVLLSLIGIFASPTQRKRCTVALAVNILALALLVGSIFCAGLFYMKVQRPAM